jgi:DNA polymerase-3 subunit delta
MSASAEERAFYKSLKSKTFAPVYYIHGEDEYRKDEAVRALIEAAVDPATSAFNLDIWSGGDLNAEIIGSLAGTPPMMAPRRVIVVRDVASLRKEARAALDEVLDRVPPSDAAGADVDVLLVLVAASGEKAKVDKALQRVALSVPFAPLSGERIPRWIEHHARTVLGTSITPEAVSMLERVVGSDLPALAAELDKAASYRSGGEIDGAAVEAVAGVRHGETLGDFLDRVADRDAAASLRVLPGLLEQPRMTGVSIVMALTVQTLALSHARGLRDGGTPQGRINGELFTLLKTTRAYPFRPWGEAVSSWTSAVDKWSGPALDEALDALARTDLTLKDTRASSEEQVIATLVLTMCATNANARERNSGRDAAA